MSHWDSDLDHADWLNGPYGRPNARCSDCGADFTKGRDDIGSLCDRCCTQRDALAEIALHMTTAKMPASRRKEIA